MNHSDQINEIAAALAKAQGAFEAATKDAINPHFNRRYADLASGINAIRAALCDNGIAVVQDVSAPEAGTVAVTTTLAHSSGQYLTFGPLVMPVRDDPQGIGSGITYARRYALFAAVGIAPEDDDANTAMPEKPRPQPRPKTEKAPQVGGMGKHTPEQSRVLKELTKQLGFTSPAQSEALCREVTGNGPAALTEESAQKLIEHMQSLIMDRGMADKPEGE